MINCPVILVLSEGQEPPETIIKNIRKQPETEDVDCLLTLSTGNVNGYKFHLITKYYETDLYLVPFKDDISVLPTEVQEATEAVLIYFDSGKRSFSNRIPTYANFLKNNDIELGILLCDRLYENSNEGITYKDAKQASRFLDVIELGRTRDEDEEDDPHDPLGYDELMQALRSFLWSNVQMGEKVNGLPEQSGGATNSSSSMADQLNQQGETSIESELEIFERLMTEVMHFKNATASMTKNERLAHAEQFASKFQDLIGDGPDSSDEG